MHRIKLFVVLVCVVLAAFGCFGSAGERYVITGNKAYEASLFRQNCAICHGPEGEGKTLVDGTVVPSLRKGDFKATTEGQIYKQIADGGNGMVAFRGQMTVRELQLMTNMVRNDLRK